MILTRGNLTSTSCRYFLILLLASQVEFMLEVRISLLTPCWKIILLGLIPLSTATIPSLVQAGCVSSDINAQYTVGSRQTLPADRNNDLKVRYGNNCLGNSSHGNSLQLYSGTEPIEQNRKRDVYLDSERNYFLPGLNTPNIDANVNQQIHLPILPRQ